MIANTEDFTDEQKLDMALQLIKETKAYQDNHWNLDCTITRSVMHLAEHMVGQQYV